MSLDETKKYALVTGCSQDTGLGLQLATELIAAGYTVFATARSSKRLEKAIAAGCLPVELDVTDAKSIAAAVKHVADITSGRLQCLINNAGAVGRGLTLDADLNKYKYIFDVNFFGCLAMAQAFAPLLIRTSQQDKGKDGFVKPCIMNVGSISETGSPHVSAYSCSKAALRSLSTALRVEMAGLGVQVIHVTLGSLRGPFAVDPHTYLEMELNASDASTWNKNGDLNVRKQDEMVYRDCGKEVWDAGMRITKDNHEKTPHTPESVSKELVKAVDRAGPPVIHIGYSAWATKWIVPLLPYTTFDNSVIKIAGLNLVKPNSDAGDEYVKRPESA